MNWIPLGSKVTDLPAKAMANLLKRRAACRTTATVTLLILCRALVLVVAVVVVVLVALVEAAKMMVSAREINNRKCRLWMS
jgi:hypothetical protein